ncbi:MAG: hypothetical protein M0D57_01285 [Sphingobacteriales bacterium JAD_PAG50586_3]|nr:MAG: hypothetical protein M0D57_01285 [Sphingobacteriales bacterium JAD_PAG50586_3]
MKLFSAKNTAYIFHGLTIIYALLTAYSFISGDESALDINTQDTYYVIASAHVYLLLFIFHIMLAIIYTYVKPKINFFNLIHGLGSVLIMAVYFGGGIAQDAYIVIGLFYLFATFCFLINVTYTLLSILIKPK